MGLCNSPRTKSKPFFPPSQVASQVYPYAESLCEYIREANPCTDPVFFMTWGRENGDSQNCAAYPPICTYEGMQDRLTEIIRKWLKITNLC